MSEGPSRILMTIDAVGGVWRYAMDLAAELRLSGIETVFAGFGPRPSPVQAREAVGIGTLVWSDLPLDWMCDDEAALDGVPALLRRLVTEHRIDLVHLNLPSQAAGLDLDIPVVVVSHSCVVTWFEAVRGSDVPAEWQWHRRRNQRGFAQADAVLAPSRSHAAALRRCYGPIAGLDVIHNASRLMPELSAKADFVFAAGRWWDDGKNGAVLDQAAARINWPVVMAGATTGPAGQVLHLHHARHSGELNHQATMDLMRRAAIVVSPSLCEPFGLAALEAARAGAALVLADIPTYSELWEGVALFADPHDPQAFADAVNRLAGDPDLRARLGRLAQQRSRQFSPDNQAAALHGVYGRLMSSVAYSTAAEVS